MASALEEKAIFFLADLFLFHLLEFLTSLAEPYQKYMSFKIKRVYIRRETVVRDINLELL